MNLDNFSSLSDKKNDLWAYLILIISSIVFLLINSTSTSPLYIGHGPDSAVFIILGKLLLAGKTPYIDFFDHKGPMLIFIEAFGQSLASNERTGLFILQCISLTISSSIIYKTSRLLLPQLYSLSIVFISFIFLRYTIEGGNLTEEYSLPFNMYALYVAFSFLLAKVKIIKPIQSIGLGICSAILFWIRLNNMNVLTASVIFILIIFILNKDWKYLLNFLVAFFVGFFIISVPIIIYYTLYLGAFYDMIYASFIFNLKYINMEDNASVMNSTQLILYIFRAWIPFIVLFVGTILIYSKNKNYQFILLGSLLLIIGFITTHIGSAFSHYMMLNIPCLVIGLIFILYSIYSYNKSVRLSIIIFSVILIPAFIALFISFLQIPPKTGSEFDKNTEEIVSKIPLNERNSVYPYHTSSRFLATAQLLPCYKYSIMQEWHMRSDKSIKDQINGMMEHNPPKWVVTQYRSQSTNAEFWEIIDHKYTLYFSNNSFELFKLKD